LRLHIDTAVHKKLIKLSHIAVQPSDSPISLSSIATTLTQINRSLKNKSLSDSKRLLLEDYKRMIIESILTYLNSFNRLNRVNEETTRQQKKGRGVLGWLKAGFIFLISLVGLAESSAGSYLGMSNLLSQLFSNISNFWLLAATIGVTAINFVLFIAFEIDMLKTMFNFSSGSTAKKIIETHEKQINTLELINKKLVDINLISQVTQNEYRQLANLTTKLNKDAESKRSTYEKYKEHPFKKIVRIALTVAGAALCGLGSYWGGGMMLAAIAAPLVGTPLGWCIIGGLILSNLVFYFAMQGTGIKNLFNPCMSAFKKMKEILRHFTTNSENDFSRIMLTNKNAFKKRSTNDAALDLARPRSMLTEQTDRLVSDRGPTVEALVDPSYSRYRP
jgi:hypothetical protein